MKGNESEVMGWEFFGFKLYQFWLVSLHAEYEICILFSLGY